MIAYLDSSVLMRIILREPNPLAEWPDLRDGVSSELLIVEGFRTFDRLWHLNELTEEELAEKRATFSTFLRRLDIRALDKQVLEIAAQPFPASVATLDAIHLATAIVTRASLPPSSPPLLFATHDLQLARAARALHFEVLGA